MQMTEQHRARHHGLGRRKRCGAPFAGASRLYLAMLLIIAGLLLFLGNLGLFPLHSVFQLWPLALVAVGLGRWTDSAHAGNRLWSSMLIVFGAVFFCTSMGFLHLRAHDGTWIIAIALIAVGVLALTKTMEVAAPPPPPAETYAPPDPFADSHPFPEAEFSQSHAPPPQGDFLNDSAILGSVQRRVESANFRGGVLNSILGSIELDLRRAQMLNPSEPVHIEATCVMGSITLRIPETWRFSIVGVPVLGSYQDKTIPIARPDFVSGTLVISGSCVMGSIEIES